MHLNDIAVGFVFAATGIVLFVINVGLFYMAFIEKPLTPAAEADRFWSRWILLTEILGYGTMFYSIWKGWI